jgi:hypothetical protein
MTRLGELRRGPLTLSADWGVAASCMFLEDAGECVEYVLYRIGLACLRKIARVSDSPNSSEPAEKKNSLLLSAKGERPGKSGLKTKRQSG